MTAATGRVPNFALLGIVTFVAGMAWIVVLASLNVTAQTMCPPQLRARAISLYLLVLQGGMALGATVWGAIASRIGIPTALTCAGAALLVGLSLAARHRLAPDELPVPAAAHD
jgi:predicted MFS family arabinose efflux permease